MNPGEPVRLEIVLMPDGQLKLSANCQDKSQMLWALEHAKDLVMGRKTQQQEQSPILVARGAIPNGRG